MDGYFEVVAGNRQGKLRLQGNWMEKDSLSRNSQIVHTLTFRIGLEKNGFAAIVFNDPLKAQSTFL
jgi:hypothetical protein